MRNPKIEVDSTGWTTFEFHQEIYVIGANPNGVDIQSECPYDFFPPVDCFHNQKFLSEFVLCHLKFEGMIDVPLNETTVT